MTVRRMRREMTQREFVTWQIIYNKIEPFGEWRADERTGRAVSPIVNLLRSLLVANGYRKQPPSVPSDWIMDFLKEVKPKKMTVEALGNVLRGIAAAAVEDDKKKRVKRGGK